MDIDKQMMDEDSKVTLTIRLIMQGKEVGSIIGKKGEIVKRFREESGAKINISDGSCPERIVTVTGTTNAIFKAFTLICKKFEDWCSQFGDMGGGGSGQNRPPITLRLIVPASQCGSLIGKGGSKIKEIRDVSGANIQVAGEMLPNSTERAVTISGSSDAITQCIYHICCVMLESPPKGATIPYRPKPQVGGPLILAGGQAYTIQGNYAVPAQDGGMYGVAIHPAGSAEVLMKGAPPAPPPHLLAALPPPHLVMPAPLPPPPPHTAAQTHHQLHQLHHPYHHLSQEHMAMGALAKNPLAGLAALGLGGLNPGNTGGLNPAALAALAGSQLRTSQNRNQQPTNQTAHEMTVPNELIGCIIGKGGTKIAEIRQISGAMIRISNCEEREGGATDRTITISGNPDSVALAQYLINMSVELQKVNLGAQGNGESSGEGNSSGSAGPLASAIPLAQLLSKPGALNALSSLTALGGLSDLLGSGPIQTTGVHRSHRGGNRSRSPQSSSGDQPGKSKIERAKYNPY